MEFLTVEEVAKLIKMSPLYIYQLKAKKQIPYTKIGSALRFNKAEIEEWLNKNSTHC